MKHILIAEDDTFLRELLETQLVNAGYQVSTARAGDEVLSFVASNTIDLAILDITIPNIDGLSVLSELRATAAYASLPVIMFTNDDTEEIRAKVAAENAMFYFKASTDTDALLSHIATLLA